MIEHDISTEQWREYDYGNGRVYRIETPVTLYIKEGGSGHRILDKEGVTHWVPVNCHYCLRWYAPAEPVSF